MVLDFVPSKAKIPADVMTKQGDLTH